MEIAFSILLCAQSFAHLPNCPDLSPMNERPDLKAASFRPVPFGPTDIRQTTGPDGTMLLQSKVSLLPHPGRMTERLVYWAGAAPDRVFLAQRGPAGAWQTWTYSQTLAAVERIAQALLDRGLSTETPIVILSENSVEHALLAFAALHIGLPHAPISPAYSLRSKDFAKLRYCIGLLTPGLIFVSDGIKYERALRAVAGGAEIVVAQAPPPGLPVTRFEALLQTPPTPAVEVAFEGVQPGATAKILFTSGSTDEPKGVINTHGNICANSQQITQTFPFMADTLELVDWLPWSHTFGGNHNLGLVLYNGGTLYIDGGNPTPAGIETTVANLRDIAPTVYFNVPKGFEELVPRLRRDAGLREQFFSRLQLLFYAGAAMPQHTWDDLEELALQTTGERVVIATGLGSTETSPAALFYHKAGGYAGLIGVPAPGLVLKLAPTAGKLEARYKGPNITPGFWRQPERMAAAFDEEGFYRSGDALRFADPADPNAGMIFDGRITEDFKLDTGTWVSVGTLRHRIIAAGNGLVQDAVITGHDQSFLGAIIFPDLNYCRTLSGLGTEATLSELIAHPAVCAALQTTLDELAQSSTGSATLIRRALFAGFTLSIDAGEITDKGTINQRAVLASRRAAVELLYAERVGEPVVCTPELCSG